MKRFLLSLFALCGAVAAATAQEEPLKLPEPEFIGQTLFGIGRDHIEEMTLNGTQARNRFRKDDGIAFIVRVPDNGIDPMSVISVFRFKVKKKKRVAEYASVGTFGDRQRNTLERQPFTSRRFGVSSYLIVLRDVEPGEYGITVDALGSLNVSTFGVDE